MYDFLLGINNFVKLNFLILAFLVQVSMSKYNKLGITFEIFCYFQCMFTHI